MHSRGETVDVAREMVAFRTEVALAVCVKCSSTMPATRFGVIVPGNRERVSSCGARDVVASCLSVSVQIWCVHV